MTMRLLLATLAATAYAQNAKLVIVAQFKNEAESLPQWLDHYLTDEGVAAMLLIDDNSTDSWRQAVEPYGARVRVRSGHARTLYEDDSASLDDLREAVATLEEIEPTARRVLGDAHPTVHLIEKSLQHTRAVRAARETPSPSA